MVANHSFRTARQRLFLSVLEDRTVPATLVGLTASNQLLTFDSASPGTITNTVSVTGLGSEVLVGIDFRPSSGQLFALSSGNQLFRVDPITGAAVTVGSPFVAPAIGTAIGMDFNPAVDKLRVVTSSGANFRINPDTGALIATDTPLAYDPATFDAAVGGTPPAPQVVATAYTLNQSFTSPGTIVTTMYNLDAGTNLLMTQGGPESDPSPNGGRLFAIDTVGFDVTEATGFDIETGTDMAFATRPNGGATEIYSISLTTAASTLLGTVPGQELRGLAIAPAQTGAGQFALSASAFQFGPNRGPVPITVTRTGGASVPATVSYATSNGTAIGGVDFLPASGTLNFAAGETTKTFFVLLPAGPAAVSPARDFTVTLSAPTGGATLGTLSTATINIPAVSGDGLPTNGRLFAAAAGNGSTVVVYDSITGAERFRFNAFEAAFTGGVTVATADVNGDGLEDIIVGAGLGGSPRVAVFDGASTGSLTTRPTVIADFFVYEESARSGVIVAAGDVNGDGLADLVVGTGQGGGPRVRVIDGASLSGIAGGTFATSLADFFAFEESARGGVNVAVGEFTGDGFADIIVGSGNGGGPRVRLLDGTALTTLTNGIPASTQDFFAYDDAFRGGVFVAAGDVNADGFQDIVTGTGPGGGPDVRVFGRGQPNNQSAGFFAFDGNQRGGVRVATNDFGPDGADEIVAAAGPGGPGLIRAFNGAAVQEREINPFGGDFVSGVFVG